MDWDELTESKDTEAYPDFQTKELQGEPDDWKETGDWKEAASKESSGREEVPSDWKEAVGWEADDSKG